MSKQRAKGTAFESELLPLLREVFGPQVERAPLKGGADDGDFLHCGVLVEAKKTDAPHLLAWAKAAAAKRPAGNWRVVWSGDRRKGDGPYVLLPLSEWLELESWSTKRCLMCDQSLPLSEFYKNSTGVKGVGSYCRPCTLADRKAKWEAKSEDQKYERTLKQQYGLTIEQYQAMVAEVGGRCPISGVEERLVVDHDHTTGFVRGVLSNKINAALGLFDDDPAALRAAADYLEAAARRQEEAA